MTSTFEEYADAIADAVVVLRDNAARAGLDNPVPTCPDWTVRDLVVHTGTVHRWAAGNLRGERIDTAALEREAPHEPDLLQWLDDGAQDLLRTLDDAPADLAAWFFLADAGPARVAWARRQCHETSIHAVDAMSAARDRPPSAGETWLRPTIAADGIDELLTGFVARERTTFRTTAPQHVLVTPTDSERRWTVDVQPGGISTTRGDGGGPDHDSVLTGSAVQLYLGLWNRGQEITESGRPFLDQWRDGMTVTWG